MSLEIYHTQRALRVVGYLTSETFWPVTATMDFQLAAVLSAAEAAIWAGVHRSVQAAPVLTLALVSRFLFYFVVQYSALQGYRLFIYPHFVSPLRHLPGPKVPAQPKQPTRLKAVSICVASTD